MKHYTVHFWPDNKSISIHHGATILEAAAQAGVIIDSPCGGIGRCGKCKVILRPDGDEVLACEYAIVKDLQVLIPERGRFFQQQILEHGIERDIEVYPTVRKVFVEDWVDSQAHLRTWLARRLDCLICETPFDERFTIEYPAGNFTAVLSHVNPCACDNHACCYRLCGIENSDTSDILFGVAADIGTTSVVARLIDLRTGRTVATASMTNPQTQFGADVVSRIHFASHQGGADKLQSVIVGCVNQLIRQVCAKAGIGKNDVYELVVVGNTTMNHLLLKRPVAQLGQAPYQAFATESYQGQPAELGIAINGQGAVYAIENIAGFVGSDTVAAAMAVGMDQTDKMTLLVDIGTNGEIVLGTKDRLFAASCAAGPALEGAGIDYGSRAQQGAIQRVLINGEDIDLDVIDDSVAATICGSGLIDAMAVLLELGIVEQTGRFADVDTLADTVPAAIVRRIVQYNDEPAFLLAGAGLDDEHKVLLTQKDVRQFQLANAAIRTGITLLLEKADIGEDRIERLLLAGAFGNYIQKESAVRCGMLPPIDLSKIHYVGNAAGVGAQMVLLSNPCRTKTTQLADDIQYVEIAMQTRFNEVFGEYLCFPIYTDPT